MLRKGCRQKNRTIARRRNPQEGLFFLTKLQQSSLHLYSETIPQRFFILEFGAVFQNDFFQNQKRSLDASKK